MSGIAAAILIGISIKMEVQGNVTAVFYSTSNGVFKMTPEFYNTGSVAYKARARLEIINATDVIFTGWSKEEVLAPGDRKTFEIYWYSPNVGKFNTSLRMYYGREVADYATSQIEIKNTQATKDIFKIENFKTYDDYIRFDIKTNQSLNNILIIPSGYITNWVFEQRRIEKIDKYRRTEVVIPYEPTVWIPSQVTIEIVTEDGKYYASRSFELQREVGVWKYVGPVIDKIRLYLDL
jgi:hypothetical protein